MNKRRHRRLMQPRTRRRAASGAMSGRCGHQPGAAAAHADHAHDDVPDQEQGGLADDGVDRHEGRPRHHAEVQGDDQLSPAENNIRPAQT